MGRFGLTCSEFNISTRLCVGLHIVTAVGNRTGNVYVFTETCMETAHGDLQDDVRKSRLTDGLDTDVSKLREARQLCITFLLESTFTCIVFFNY